MAALGDSAERIGRRLGDPSSGDGSFRVYGDGGQVVNVPGERPDASRRMGVFYNEFSAHPGTASAAYSMLTYARQDCGIENLDATLGLSGYGPIENYSPYGTEVDRGGGFGPPRSQPEVPGGTVTVIPPAQTAPAVPPTSAPVTSTTTPR